MKGEAGEGGLVAFYSAANSHPTPFGPDPVASSLFGLSSPFSTHPSEPVLTIFYVFFSISWSFFCYTNPLEIHLGVRERMRVKEKENRFS